MRSRRSRPLLLLAGLAVFLVAVLPILTASVPPILDYPNHLARMAVLGGRMPALAQFYVAQWRPLPNLAMDAVVPLLNRLMPLELAGRLFLLMILALLSGGTVALHRALAGRWSWWPWLSLLVVWDHVFLMGFLNYLFSAGVAFCGLAVWVALGQRPRLRLVSSLVFAFATYFAHLFGFGIYALGAAGLALDRAWSARTAPGRALAGLVIDGLPLVGPALLFLGFAGHADGGGLGFGKLARRLDPFFSPFDDYSRPLDAACFLLFVGTLALLWASGRVRLDARMRWPLGLFVLAQLAMPATLLTAAGAERRMPLAIFLLLLAALQPTARLSLGWTRAVLTAALLMLAARSGVATAAWLRADRLEAPRLAALGDLPRGSRLALATAPDALQMIPGTFPVVHLAAYATLRRAVFVPTLFAEPTQQPMALTPTAQALATSAPPGALWSLLADGKPDAPLLAALHQYDEILLVSHRPFALAPAVADLFTPLYADGGFVLLKWRER